jgi:hypothetical protein
LTAIHLRPLWVVVGAAAVVLVAIGSMWDRPGATAVALVLLGTAYAVRLLVDSAPLDADAPVFGAGLLLCSELAHLPSRRQARGFEDPGLFAGRLLRILAVTLTGAAVGSVALAAAAVRLAGSVALTAAGAAAAAGAVWLVAWLALRSGDR